MPVQIGLSRDYGGFDNEANDEKKAFELSSLLNRRTFVVLGFLLFALCLPVILYLDVYDEGNLPAKIQGVCLLDRSYRISCGPANITETNCTNILCCFERKTNSCYHHEPSSYYYYRKDAADSFRFLTSQEKTPLGLPSLKEVKMNYFEDKESLRIYLNDTRVSLRKMKNYLVNFDILNNENDKLSTTVYRKNTTEMLLTTLKGPLIVSEDYLEWTIQLTNVSGVLFGLGQLKIHSDVNTTVTKIIYKNQNDHNTLPMFMAYNNGKYHAVIVNHEGALQVTVLPSYLIHLKALYTGGIEIQVIDGPTPKDIYDKIRRQQTEQSFIPEWFFGLHICREGPLKNIKELVDLYTSFVSTKNKYPKFTYESECVHDDLLLHLIAENYTTAQTKKLITSLGMSENFMLSYPAQIPLYSQIFQKFKNTTIFYKNPDGTFLVGKYENFDVVYPIYSQDDVQELIEEIVELFQGVKLSGLTFTNSWPQDDNYQRKGSTEVFLDDYLQDSFSYTIPFNVTEGNDIHARYHNEFGSKLSTIVSKIFETQVSFSPVSDQNANRPLIIQNLNTSWTDLKTSLGKTLFNSLFGRNFLAAPVCGSNSYDQKLQEDLCLRWYLVAATMPLIRVSSKGLQRSPTNLYTKYTIEKVINVLDTRRSLIPYYRSILKNGGPIIRPMFFNFPNDIKVHDIEDQYMIGDGILVAHPMSPEIEIMKIYLPPNRAWYEIWGGKRYHTEKGKEWIKFPIVKSDWISFIMEGHIIPQIKKGSSGPEITLRIAMKCNSISCKADGSLLYEDFGDEIINFSASGQNITIKPEIVKEKQVKDMIKSICIYNATSSACDDSVHKYIV
ncbi:alpha-glucosidase-like [Coccinella septempunctata]|uniref:alpha-glucosidase-like n=1 Tax=Coccinella septempunctata TaxID=41139 RepID=UPI001D05E65E|nr:alpha-glucosidase-like [Coccinella septempunctata]